MSKKKWYKNFWIILAITIIDFILPDPIPLIDELLLIGWASILGLKELSK